MGHIYNIPSASILISYQIDCLYGVLKHNNSKVVSEYFKFPDNPQEPSLNPFCMIIDC